MYHLKQLRKANKGNTGLILDNVDEKNASIEYAYKNCKPHGISSAGNKTYLCFDDSV